MRIALFTSKFPARVSTFFSRDVAALLAAGIGVDIFPLYPVEETLWQCVPESYRMLLRNTVSIHHQARMQTIRAGLGIALARPRRVAAVSVPVIASSVRFGLAQSVKTCYAASYGLGAARETGSTYDHVLAYWGNYSATSAYLFRELVNHKVPFSLFLHAGVDLYRDQIFLPAKLRAAKHIIVVCDFNRHFLRAKYPALYEEIAPKIVLHHLGLELDDYGYQPQREKPVRLVAVGRMCRPKGFDVLLRALGQLAAREIRIPLTLVGGGPELARYQLLARQLGIGGETEFRGWLSPEQTKQEIAAATVLVHPSIGLGDAVPTVIKEAMALGTPVIASNVAGIPELLDEGKCGVLVPARDVNELATAIEKLTAEEGRRLALARVARERAEALFDLWENGRRLAHLLRDESTLSTEPIVGGGQVAPEERSLTVSG